MAYSNFDTGALGNEGGFARTRHAHYRYYDIVRTVEFIS